VYEPDPDHWDWLLEQIAKAGFSIRVEDAIFDWLFGLFDNPRPSPSYVDEAISDAFDIEMRDGPIPGTPVDAEWIIYEKKKRFQITKLRNREAR
jgi:hypothetical protein